MVLKQLTTVTGFLPAVIVLIFIEFTFRKRIVLLGRHKEYSENIGHARLNLTI